MQNLWYFECFRTYIWIYASIISNRSNALCVAVEARKSMIIVLECVPKSDEEPVTLENAVCQASKIEKHWSGYFFSVKLVFFCFICLLFPLSKRLASEFHSMRWVNQSIQGCIILSNSLPFLLSLTIKTLVMEGGVWT